jgi:hypothetical protein
VKILEFFSSVNSTNFAFFFGLIFFNFLTLGFAHLEPWMKT